VVVLLSNPIQLAARRTGYIESKSISKSHVSGKMRRRPVSSERFFASANKIGLSANVARCCLGLAHELLLILLSF